MSAADRLTQLNQMPAMELCAQTEEVLTALVEIMSRETMLLRAGHMSEASELTAEKTQLAENYVVLARTVQRERDRLLVEAPEYLKRLKTQHESFATQMAENLRVLATAKTVTETLLTDVSQTVSKTAKPNTYAQNGAISNNVGQGISGLSVNRAL